MLAELVHEVEGELHVADGGHGAAADAAGEEVKDGGERDAVEGVEGDGHDIGALEEDGAELVHQVGGRLALGPQRVDGEVVVAKADEEGGAGQRHHDPLHHDPAPRDAPVRLGQHALPCHRSLVYPAHLDSPRVRTRAA